MHLAVVLRSGPWKLGDAGFDFSGVSELYSLEPAQEAEMNEMGPDYFDGWDCFDQMPILQWPAAPRFVGPNARRP